MKRDLTSYLVDWPSLQRLVQDRVAEGSDLDYKREEYAAAKKPPDRRELDKEELRRDVASIANAGGGWIVVGVAEDDHGDPESLCGIDEVATHETRTRHLLEEKVEPAFGRHVKVRTIADPDGPARGALVIEISAAENHRPFAVQVGRLLEFWTRFDRNKAPMRYGQLVSAFTPTDEELQGHQLAALARSKIRAITHAMKEAHSDWKRKASLVPELRAFTQEPDLNVKSEIVRAVGEAIDRPKWGLPYELARDAVAVLSDTLPYYCLRGRQAAPPTEAEVAVLEEAAHTLWVLVHDGIRYRESLPLCWRSRGSA